MSGPDPMVEDAGIPTTEPTPALSYAPVAFSVPGRAIDLQLSVSAPATGTGLPVILFSHGHGPSNYTSSYHAYGPLVTFWATRGFAVIQPTHPDATLLNLREVDDPDAPLYALARARDMHFILDHLDEIENIVPGLAGRLDYGRVAAVGHSMGGETVNMLCGAEVTDPGTGELVRLDDGRVKVGVAIAPPGRGSDLAQWASENYPVLGTTTFDSMTTPELIVVGENDHNELFSEREDWRVDSYPLSPAPKTKLTVCGAEHMFGGISGWDVAETTDDNLERVAAVRAMIWAYLRSFFDGDDRAWSAATTALAARAEPLGTVESK